MQQIRFEVVRSTAERADIRLFGDDGRLVDQRPLETERLEALLARAEKEYQAPFFSSLDPLGAELYSLLDGETHRWLGSLRQESRKTLLLRIDVDGKLVHLPWELMAEGGRSLCALGRGGLLPVRQVGGEAQVREVQNRPLRLLFMACDPIGVAPSLCYEAEEARILEATRRPQLELEVEESGWIGGLGERLGDFGGDYFDIFHLTGHARMGGDGPYFLMESDVGLPEKVTPEQLQEVFADSWPHLIFLSGCETGKSLEKAAFPSFCEALVRVGAPAVLGWALPVADDIASRAAEVLYSRLALGQGVAEAVVAARADLHRFEQEHDRLGRDANWHLLRLYSDATGLDPLVTAKNTPGRAKLLVRPARQAFLDAQAKGEVCPRERFVGRRRQLQESLRVLRTRPGDEDYSAGLAILGMGGLGKSSLAARLCDRLRHRRLVLVGHLDEQGLLMHLGRLLRDPQLNERLQEPDLDLQSRLEIALEGPLHNEPVLFVLDDFEQNVEPADGVALPESAAIGPAPRRDAAGHAVLRPAPLAALTALLGAIHTTGSDSRAIVTSRYELALPGPARLKSLPLHHFSGPALEKKLGQLESFRGNRKVSGKLQDRLRELAGGNPRLLEWLDKVVAVPTTEVAPILSAMEEVVEAFREETLLRVLLGQQAAACRRLLAALSRVYLPVDRGTVEVMAAAAGVENPKGDTGDAVDIDNHLAHAISLGLLEETPGVGPPEGLEGASTANESYFVSTLLAPLLEPELEASMKKEIAAQACRHLFAVWWENLSAWSEEMGLEILRLAMAGESREIAAQTCSGLAHHWYNMARYSDAVHLCQGVLEEFEDFRVLMALARSEQILGKATDAIRHYERALEAAPPEEEQDEAQKKTFAATLHNLALLLLQQGEVGKAQDLWAESHAITKSIGNQKDQAATLHQMAVLLFQQGEVGKAEDLWSESLAIKKSIGDQQGQAATLHNLASLLLQQGEVGKAEDLWSESLAIWKSIGDQQGQASTLHQMAGLLFQQGEVGKAEDLWSESLAITKSIGDQQGQAATLAQMAWAAGQAGDASRELELNLEAARVLGQVRAFGDLITVLGNLGVSDVPGRDVYLAQAFWLAARIEAPLPATLSRAAALVQRLELSSELAPFVAATAAVLMVTRGGEHPDGEELQSRAISLLAACGQAHGVADEDFQDWLVREGLADRAKIFPALLAGLEELIGDGWLFDPSLFSSDSR